MRASDTLGGHGSITIATRRRRIDDTSFPSPAGVPTGDYAEISLRSAGPADAAARASADAGKTDWDFSELGMAMVVSALEEIGGHLATTGHSLESDVLSEITIYLPVADDMTATTATAVDVDDGAGDAVILLVEDEAAVRNVLSRALRDRGYQVLEAQNGEDALSVATMHAAPIDLVVSDVVMPQMDGRALFDQLRRWYPGIRFLFVSGYTRGALATADLQGPVTDFLAKPFSMDALAIAVRRLLDRRATSTSNE